jgi:2,4-dienoyl-CoA reductase-like NADH-dependent reductase (Old Yellow Enzyme family)
MTSEDIEDVIERFVFVAKVAKEVGFTGIQLHSAHGYLLSQFLSPDINLREDEWGGSVESRSKLLVTIIRRCKVELGDKFPISVKLNSTDFQKGGFTPEDSINVAKILEREGVHLLEISGGTYEQPRLIGLDDVSINPERSIKRKKSTIAREAFFLDYAEKIRKNVSMPLMVTGGFRTLEGMNNALKSGVCDIIGIARPLCGDPNSAGNLIKENITELPSYEKTLQIGRGFLSTSSRFLLIQALNAFSQMAWFYMQIKRMGDGNDPSMKLGILKAYRLNGKDEKRVLKSLDV